MRSNTNMLINVKLIYIKLSTYRQHVYLVI